MSSSSSLPSPTTSGPNHLQNLRSRPTNGIKNEEKVKNEEKEEREKVEELCHANSDVKREEKKDCKIDSNKMMLARQSCENVKRENEKSDDIVLVVVKGSGRRKKSHPVRQIVNSCVVAYSEPAHPNPVDLTNKPKQESQPQQQQLQEPHQQQQQQQQQPVILSVPHYNPALESAARYNLPSTTITIRTPGKFNLFNFNFFFPNLTKLICAVHVLLRKKIIFLFYYKINN
jgi:hypothetical protein